MRKWSHLLSLFLKKSLLSSFLIAGTSETRKKRANIHHWQHRTHHVMEPENFPVKIPQLLSTVVCFLSSPTSSSSSSVEDRRASGYQKNGDELNTKYLMLAATDALWRRRLSCICEKAVRERLRVLYRWL